MSAHPEAFERLATDLTRTKDRVIQDELLDRWLEYQNLATDWDAEKWGFNPEKWMHKERAELILRAQPDASRSDGRLDRGVL